MFSALLYWGSLGGGFVGDDRTYFLDNDILPRLKPWQVGAIVLSPSNYWGELLPVRDFLYVAEYSAFGRQTTGYHVVSMLLYGLVCCAALAVCRELYRGPLCNGLTPDERERRALFAALFFLASPLHVEAVAYISGQKDLLCGLFSLIGTACFVRALGSEARRRGVLLAATVGAYYASLLSKHTGVANALILPVLWLFYERRTVAEAGRAGLFWIAVNVPAALWLFYSLSVENAMKARGMGGAFVFSTERIVLMVRVLGAHVLLALRQFPLNFGYPFDEAQHGDAALVSGALFVAVTAVVLAVRRRRLETAALVLFFLYLFPALQLIHPLFNSSVYDRYLFLPVIGIGILAERISTGIAAAQRRGRAIAAVVVLTAMVAATASYIPSFRDDATLAGRSYRMYPGWPPAAFGYVYALIEAGRLDEAERITAAEPTFSDPVWVRDYFTGWIRIQRGEPAAALKTLEVASYSAMAGGYFPFPNLPYARALLSAGDRQTAREVLQYVMMSGIHQPVEQYRARKLLEAIAPAAGG